MLAGRLEPPNPCGARPRSEVLPCPSQTRELFPGRCEEVAAGLFIGRFELGAAEGGRFCESSCCRAVIPELAGALPDLSPKPPLALAGPLTEELPRRPFVPAEPLAPTELLTCEFPNRPVEIPALLNVCTRECAAAAAGVVRAITERFSVALDGRATPEWKFEAPSELCGAGLMPVGFVALTFCNADAERCC